jgi:hypothetical protein
MTLNKFDSHPETAKLKPWLPAMFVGTSFSLLNYDNDFFQLVKDGKIRVHVSEITHLSPGKVHLSDGVQLPADVFLANTGWKHVPPVKFFPEGIEKELGIPHFPSSTVATTSAEDLGSQPNLLNQADQQILQRFPRLKNQPTWNKSFMPLLSQKGIDSSDAVTPSTPLTPFMLHRFTVPSSPRFLRTRDVAFVGFVSNFSNILTAHLQGLWVGAYFARKLSPDAERTLDTEQGDGEQLRRETVLHNRFGRWRYPVDWGSSRAPSFIFDAVPFMDLLQRDLGLDPHRKKGALAEAFSPYGPEDYRGVNDEWEAMQAAK